MKNEKPRIVGTRREVAQEFEVSVAAVEKWRAEGMPGEKGRWDLAAISKWHTDRTERNGRGKENAAALEDGASLDHWELRFRRARAEIHELELAARRGQLVERRLVEESFIARVLETKRGLMGLGRQLAPQLVGRTDKEIAIIVDTATHQLLEEFARAGIPSISDGQAEKIIAAIESMPSDAGPPPKKRARTKRTDRGTAAG